MKTIPNLRLDKHSLETVHEKVLRILREAILRGDFAPGERLVQDELAAAIGVSRMPVREALRKLEIEGLIVMEPHRGAVVKTLSADEVEEVYVLRSQLERLALVQSIQGMTDEDIQKLEQLHKIMEETEVVSLFVKTNIEFHQVLLCRCPWKRLLGFIDTLWTGLPQQTPYILKDQMVLSNREHREIIEAIKRGDAEQAGEILSAHIRRTGQQLVENMKKKKTE